MENHLENWTMNIYMGKEVASHHCCKPKEIQGPKKKKQLKKENKIKQKKITFLYLLSFHQSKATPKSRRKQDRIIYVNFKYLSRYADFIFWKKVQHLLFLNE